MCRHLAYLGPPVELARLVLTPSHGLYEQSWAPRRQTHGVVNADGFGLGWYPSGPGAGEAADVGGGAQPARYRRAAEMKKPEPAEAPVLLTAPPPALGEVAAPPNEWRH